MEVLMTRYILEIMQEPKLIKLYNNGIWYPNFDDYHLYLHKFQKNNENFAKLIQRYRLVKNSDHIIETIFSDDLEKVSSFLKKDAIFIKADYGTIRCPNPSTMVEPFLPSTCYISNGFFANTETIALKLVGCGSFAIGVCDNPTSIFYRDNKKRMENFQKILKKRHIPYRQYQHKNHRDTANILYYRCDTL